MTDYGQTLSKSLEAFSEQVEQVESLSLLVFVVCKPDLLSVELPLFQSILCQRSGTDSCCTLCLPLVIIENNNKIGIKILSLAVLATHYQKGL